MAELVKVFEENTLGNDYAVGDIHGCYSKLENKLNSIGFKPEKDRLFCPGDIVNRGMESAQFTRWLKQPWFHASRGNHEEMCLMFLNGEYPGKELAKHGGGWLTNILHDSDRPKVREYIESLPFAMEVNTPNGLIGLVHANIPGDSWVEFKNGLNQERDSLLSTPNRNIAMWDSTRYKNQDCTPIKDLRAMVTGHNRIKYPIILGNVYHIDTGAVWGGSFTILNLKTLNTI